MGWDAAGSTSSREEESRYVGQNGFQTGQSPRKTCASVRIFWVAMLTQRFPKFCLVPSSSSSPVMREPSLTDFIGRFPEPGLCALATEVVDREPPVLQVFFFLVCILSQGQWGSSEGLNLCFRK